MSSPLSSLHKGRRAPLSNSNNRRRAPFRNDSVEDVDSLIEAALNMSPSNKKVSEEELLLSMMSRLAQVEKQLHEERQASKEKMSCAKNHSALEEGVEICGGPSYLVQVGRRIKILEDKCQLYKQAKVENTSELERKCYKLQRQVQEMEIFLEDYGMIWCGGNFDTEDEEEEIDEDMWKPDDSVFNMDYDLVLKNIGHLNEVAGQDEHYVKYTNDGARLKVKESVPLTLYKDGIFMFSGPFRSFAEPTTQTCMKDLMDGYFPSELRARYPEGVPFQAVDQRGVDYKDEKLASSFPGSGHALSPQKNDTASQLITKGNNLYSFLSNLPSSIVKNGKVIDVRQGLKEHIQPTTEKNDAIVIDTEVVKEIKNRWDSKGGSRPQTPAIVTTLRVKSETGNQIYILKMRYSQTIADVRKYIDGTRETTDVAYDLKTSFPNRSYTELDRTLQEYRLVPNATLYIVLRTENSFM